MIHKGNHDVVTDVSCILHSGRKTPLLLLALVPSPADPGKDKPAIGSNKAGSYKTWFSSELAVWRGFCPKNDMGSSRWPLLRCKIQTRREHNLKNIERHTADTIVSWPNPKQWVIVHTSDLMMIIRYIYILSIITTEMGKLKTYSPTYCIMDNGENMLNLTHLVKCVYACTSLLQLIILFLTRLPYD